MPPFDVHHCFAFFSVTCTACYSTHTKDSSSVIRLCSSAWHGLKSALLQSISTVDRPPHVTVNFAYLTRKWSDGNGQHINGSLTPENGVAGQVMLLVSSAKEADATSG